MMVGCAASAATPTETPTEAATEAATETQIETASETAEEGPKEQEMFTVVDDRGIEVTFPKNPERIVISSILPLTSVFCLYRGGTDGLVGIAAAAMSAAENSYLAKMYPRTSKFVSDTIATFSGWSSLLDESLQVPAGHLPLVSAERGSALLNYLEYNRGFLEVLPGTPVNGSFSYLQY